MLLDKQVLQTLANNVGADAIDTLIAIYIEDTQNTIKKLEKACTNDDFAAIALESHTLKSVSSTYGASEALELSKSIDAKCKAHEEVANLKPEVKKLIEVLTKTLEAFKAFDFKSLI